ncbi:hypothetical protein JOM56_006961 [Amanita muscaria]
MDIVDGTRNKTGENEDTGLALSVSFDTANSLLENSGNHVSTPTVQPETQQATTTASYPGMEVNEQQTTSDHQANALNVASPVSVMTSNTGTLVNAATTDSQGKGKKTGGNRKKRVYPNSTKPEHLFAADFQKLHGGNATTEQFNIAWQALSAEEKLFLLSRTRRKAQLLLQRYGTHFNYSLVPQVICCFLTVHQKKTGRTKNK